MTGGKRAEEALQESETRYHNVFGNTGTGILIIEEGMMIPLLNTEFEKLPGHTQGAEGKKKWTGVELSVIWGTVKDHDGYIDVRSVEGQGSTFTLYFPVTREELPEQHTTVSMSEYMGRGGVDPDCGRYRNSAGTGGPDARKTELPCPDGPQRRSVSGVHIGSPRGPSCPRYVMDPGMDGLDTYRKIVEIHPRQKAIIVSGYSETDRVKRAQALGAGAYVKKPFVLETLGLAVRSELERTTLQSV